MERHLTAAMIKMPLMEIEDDLRGMLVADRARSTAAIAIHLFLRLGKHYQFRRDHEPAAMNDVVVQIVDAICGIPEETLADFAAVDADVRAVATDTIANEVFLDLTRVFTPVYVREPYGGG
ncbi:hypothetical protein [Sinorhizobium terangae]|uniref:hypothetical protein n=1 Tax=Sinorhizobium terangae TaxID=110322 RepID=UPI0024B13397|nr:hypothetical protein [Sinorhizobium terangae]WFU50259.1 hypothetical protein QA637_26155 [Sinorhizobium terangae]